MSLQPERHLENNGPFHKGLVYSRYETSWWPFFPLKKDVCQNGHYVLAQLNRG